jgi:hypothetical protein
MNEREAANIVEQKHPEYVASAAMKLGNGFVVNMKGKDGEELLDCMYAVNEDGTKVMEFNPEACFEEFQKALPNVVEFGKETKQSAIIPELDDFLEHHGVKGMQIKK